ncbi:hypothetical protein GW17_00030355 [Ensete ventricosum]|nr:hypothetical protein GW17_00030355 [Ensete ventricosum]
MVSEPSKDSEKGRPAPMQGWPPTTRPRPRPPVRGWLPMARASPKGRLAALTRGSTGGQKRRPQAQPAAGRPCRQQGRRRQPQGWPPFGRATASGQGQPPPTQGDC